MTTSLPAFAQDEEMLEEIVVTGSRIKRDGFSSTSPLLVYDESDIKLAGNASIDEFLKYQPAFTGYQMGGSTNNGSDQGQRKVSLRGLGFNRTLVLINGRRQIGDATEDGAVDLNTVPEAMIKRVEVLTDGASTIYGTDALAGVVNFILDDEFEGLRVSGQYGEGVDDGQAVNERIDLLAGVAGDAGNMVFSMSYSNQEEMVQAQRPWATAALYPVVQPDGSLQAVPAGSSNSRRIRTASGNFIYDSALGQARPFETGDVYNYAPVNALTQPNERWQFGAIGKIEFTDYAEGYFEGIYTRRTSQQRLAPDASFAVSSSVDTPNNGAQWNDFVPANNPFNPFGSVNCSNTINLCNIDVRINRRFEESGGRLFRQTSDNYRMVAGLRGLIADSVNWDFSYTYAETETTDETRNYGRFDRWAVAVDPVACGADPACPGVLDPFSEFGGITPAQMAYLSTNSLKDLYSARLEMFSLVLSGEFAELGGGAIGWAAGYDYRRENGFYSPDEFLSEGLTTGGASDPLSGGFNVGELYGEIALPITENINVDASVRYSDYNTSAGDNTTYKIGGDWQIIDSVRVRATYSTGFRAPNIAELNQANSSTFPIVDNPCELGDRRLAAGSITQDTWDNCQTAGFNTTDAGEYGFAWQSVYTTSSAGNLEAEESTTYVFGVVFEPTFAPGLQASVDFYSIEIDNVIGEPDFNTIFNTCMSSPGLMVDAGGNPVGGLPACSAIDPATGLNFFGFPGDGIAQFGNLGTEQMEGFDVSVSYANSFGNSGLGYLVKWDATWMDSYEQSYTLSGTQELAGTANGFGVFPELRWNLNLGLNGDSWSVNWNMRYIDETQDALRPASAAADVVAEDIMYHDLVGTYTWDRFQFTLGINNLTDEDPPYFHSAFNANTEPGLYDVIGQRVFLGFQADF